MSLVPIWAIQPKKNLNLEAGLPVEAFSVVWPFMLTEDGSIYLSRPPTAGGEQPENHKIKQISQITQIYCGYLLSFPCINLLSIT